MSKLILTVDDSAGMRALLASALTAHGLRVESAGDGATGLDRMRELKPDLLIADLNMPDVNGFQLVEAVRADAEFRDTPILILSTEFSDEKKALAQAAGATGWITKPFDPEKLAAAVRCVCLMSGGRRARCAPDSTGKMAGSPAPDARFAPWFRAFGPGCGCSGGPAMKVNSLCTKSGYTPVCSVAVYSDCEGARDPGREGAREEILGFAAVPGGISRRGPSIEESGNLACRQRHQSRSWSSTIRTSMRAMIRRALQDFGFKDVRDKAGAAEALSSVKSDRVHLIISDFNMPEMDGLQFLEAVRADPVIGKTVFIMLTGSSRSRDRAEGCRAWGEQLCREAVRARRASRRRSSASSAS